MPGTGVSPGELIMPVIDYYFIVPFPGYVDICINGMEMRFSEQSVRQAIANIKAKKDTFATEAAYNSILNIYEQALRVLLKEETK